MAILQDSASYPHINPWVGSRTEWSDILTGPEVEAAGGQRRRLGRFLFACKAQGDEGFTGKLRQQVHELRSKTGESSIVFHVCCGLAGGTGSGTLVDVVAQIRKAYPERSSRIVVYALLPDTVPISGWDTGNYHANGYAALLELNALAVSSYHPWDICTTIRPDPSKLEDGRIRFGSSEISEPAFNGCYVFTTENEHGKILDLAKDEVSRVVASFLYQKIIMVGSTEWSGVLSRYENAENKDGSSEIGAGSKIPERSKRFLSFGVKRIVIPEEEIREYLTYQFARQAVLQLHFNHWSKTHQGYLDEPSNEAFAQYAGADYNHARWLMSDGHLCLEVGILEIENESKWKPIEVEWNTVTKAAAELARQTADPKTWMGNLTRHLDEFFNLRWRGKGVVDFYKTKQGDQAHQARAILKMIEKDLFADWVSGKRSMFDIGEILKELRKVLKEKISNAERKISEFRKVVEAAGPDIRKNNQTWANIGPLSGVFGKREAVLLAQSEVFLRRDSARHRVEAWTYAAALLEKIIGELETMASHVAANISLFAEIMEGGQSADKSPRFEGLKERISSRCKEDEEFDVTAQVVKLYEPSKIREFATRLIRSEEIQTAQTASVRRAILNALGESTSFSKFHEKLNRGVLMDLLDTVCRAEAVKAHDQLPDLNANRILGNNIVDKLYRMYAGNALQLGLYIKKLVDSAGLNINLDESERRNSSPGSAPDTYSMQLTVMCPKAREFPAYRDDVVDAVKSASNAGATIVEGAKDNEITIVSIANHFPLRYVRQIKFLETKYKKRLIEHPKARLELHTEGDGSAWPPLFLLSAKDVNLLPLMIIARAMGIVIDDTDALTGKPVVVKYLRDASGNEDVEVLGGSDAEVVEKKDVRLANQLSAIVNAKLASEFRSESKRDLVRAFIGQMRERVEAANPSVMSKERQAFAAAAKQVAEILAQ
jgi:hypothetical protein